MHTMSFRVQRDTLLLDLMTEFANNFGINLFERQFSCHGSVITHFDTPDEHKMKNGETIDNIPFPVKPITIGVRENYVGEPTEFKIQTNTKLVTVFKKFALRNRTKLKEYTFLDPWDHPLDGKESPGFLGLSDYDVIECEKSEVVASLMDGSSILAHG